MLEKAERQQVDILGVKVDKVIVEEVVERVRGMVKEAGKHYVVTPNPEFVVWAQKDEPFRQTLNAADLSIPDGIGLLAAAKFLSFDFSDKPFLLRFFLYLFAGLHVGWAVLFDQKYLDVIIQRVSGADLVVALLGSDETKGWRVFLLGGGPGVAELAARFLKKNYALNIVGTFSGDASPAGDAATVEVIKRVEPVDLLLVAYGYPKQERWIERNLPKLGVKVAIGVGGAFDFWAQRAKRAPRGFQKFGLEWLWRLIRQPSRLRRIFNAFPYFPLLIFWRKLAPKAA